VTVAAADAPVAAPVPRAGLRIAMLLASLGRGGTETQALSLARGLAETGCHVDLFVMYGDESVGSHDEDWPVSAWLRFGGQDHGGPRRDVVRGALSLRRLLVAGRYQVLHSALARAYVAAPVLAPLRRRPRLVAWRRSISADAARGRLADAVERWSAARTDALIANSHAVAQAVTAHDRVAADKVHVIHNHLPEKAFADDVRPAHPGRDLVTVANLRRVKRLDVLLDALKILQDRGRCVSAALVGDGPERASLQAMVQRYQLDVTFAGSVSDPRPWLAAAPTFVQSSESEGLSNALLEAMAQRKSVIATAVGGTEEALGDTGILIPPRDPPAMAEAITRLLDDAEYSRACAAKAHARAVSQFSLDQSVSRHLAVYGAR
jgi:glycosyltransferase involved in cell wall biosynthesis